MSFGRSHAVFQGIYPPASERPHMDEEEDGIHRPRDPGAVAPENEAVQSHWDQVVADMEATADAYRADDWTVLEIHPGDVVTLSPERADRWGLDLLVPDDEFRDLREWVDAADADFDACEVFRAQGGGVLYLVVAMQDTDAERVVLFPAFYDPARAKGMLTAAEDAGEMRTHLRPLTNDPVVTFTQSDPDLFAPP